MNDNSLQYSLKVWLTAVLVAPFIGLILALIVRPPVEIWDLTAIIPAYLLLAFFSLVLSSPTWIMFIGFIKLILLNIEGQMLRKWLIFFSGILLTALTSMLFSSLIDKSPFEPEALVFTLIYAPCIGAGCWIYKLDFSGCRNQV